MSKNGEIPPPEDREYALRRTAMRIAVCDGSAAAADELREWIRQYCLLYGIAADIECIRTPEELDGADIDIAFVGFGGRAGFLSARKLRERRRRVILVDDNGEYATEGVRIHCSDFIVRPITFAKVVRSMALALRDLR